MAASGDLRVSSRGQLCLPAATRRRWDVQGGGDVGYLDLGDALLVVPEPVDQLRSRMLDAIEPDDWTSARGGFGDDDLSTE